MNKSKPVSSADNAVAPGASPTPATPEPKPQQSAHMAGAPSRPLRAASRPGQLSQQRHGKATKAGAQKTPTLTKGTKTARVLALLQRPTGATLRDLCKATGWQPHSVRGFLSGVVHKKRHLKVKSSKRADAERVYSIKK